MADMMYTGAKALLRNGDSILAVKNEIDGTHFWALPGGRLEYGENPREALERELEELRLKEVEIGELAGQYHFFLGGESRGEQVNLMVFEAETSSDPELGTGPEVDGIVEFDWFKPGELAERKVAPDLARFLRELEGEGELPKLVRDRVPEKIRKEGLEPQVSRAEGPERFAREKVLEEAAEFEEEGDHEELADLLEAVDHYIESSGISRERIEEIQERKNREAGGFSESLVLRGVER
jgi:predicted house-cleaning noncanonical NTP pyrophosphatase (MazG superfamily)